MDAVKHSEYQLPDTSGIKTLKGLLALRMDPRIQEQHLTVARCRLKNIQRHAFAGSVLWLQDGWHSPTPPVHLVSPTLFKRLVACIPADPVDPLHERMQYASMFLWKGIHCVPRTKQRHSILMARTMLCDVYHALRGEPRSLSVRPELIEFQGKLYYLMEEVFFVYESALNNDEITTSRKCKTQVVRA